MFLAERPETSARAESYFREALRLNPDDPDATNALVSLMTRQGRWNEVLPLLRNTLRLHPEDLYAWVNLGNVLATNGDHAGDWPPIRRPSGSTPRAPNAHANLGGLLWIQGKLDEAQAHFVAALDHDPDRVQARRALEALRHRRGTDGTSPIRRTGSIPDPTRYVR